MATKRRGQAVDVVRKRVRFNELLDRTEELDSAVIRRRIDGLDNILAGQQQGIQNSREILMKWSITMLISLIRLQAVVKMSVGAVILVHYMMTQYRLLVHQVTL